MFYNLKGRFPYFLGDRSEKLFELIVEHIFSNTSKETLPTCQKFENFIFEFHQEISITLNVLNNFLQSKKYKVISKNKWTNFCFTHTLF